MQWFAGTSGYSYKEWKGSFYPEKIKPADMLEYYGTRLRSVEINNTFYRLPRRNVLEGWASKTGEEFPYESVVSPSPSEPAGEPWDEDDLERLYPELCERFF